MTYYFGNDETRPLSSVLPQTTSTDKFTQELRLVSHANETFDWLIGGFYTNEESEILQQILAVEAGTDTPAAGIPVLADLALPSDYEEFALFGDATWHITPDFDLSFGARGSWNDQTASQSAEGPLVGGSAQYPEATLVGEPIHLLRLTALRAVRKLRDLRSRGNRLPARRAERAAARRPAEHAADL